MESAVFALFVASGLCLMFSVMTAIYALRTLEKAREFMWLVWDMVHGSEEEYKKEGTE